MCEKSLTMTTDNTIELKAEGATENEVMSMEKNLNSNNPQTKANTESPYLGSKRQWGKTPNQPTTDGMHVC